MLFRSTAPGEFGRGECARYLSPEMCEMLKSRGDTVDGVLVHGTNRWRVESCRRRQRHANVGIWAHGQSRLLVIRDAARCDGGAEKWPGVHGFGKSFEEDGKIC